MPLRDLRKLRGIGEFGRFMGRKWYELRKCGILGSNAALLTFERRGVHGTQATKLDRD
jgi:hypothetical protein